MAFALSASLLHMVFALLFLCCMWFSHYLFLYCITGFRTVCLSTASWFSHCFYTANDFRIAYFYIVCVFLFTRFYIVCVCVFRLFMSTVCFSFTCFYIPCVFRLLVSTLCLFSFTCFYSPCVFRLLVSALCVFHLLQQCVWFMY